MATKIVHLFFTAVEHFSNHGSYLLNWLNKMGQLLSLASLNESTWNRRAIINIADVIPDFSTVEITQIDLVERMYENNKSILEELEQNDMYSTYCLTGSHEAGGIQVFIDFFSRVFVSFFIVRI